MKFDRPMIRTTKLERGVSRAFSGIGPGSSGPIPRVMPQFGAAQTSINWDYASTQNAVMPTGITPGQLLVIAVGGYNPTNSALFNTPSGWTRAFQEWQAAAHVAIFWKIATGNGADVTITASRSWRGGTVFARFTNVDPTTPVNAIASAKDPATSPITVLGPSTTYDNSLAVGTHVRAAGDADTVMHTGTTGTWTPRAHIYNQFGGIHSTTDMLTRELPLAGDVGTSVFRSPGATVESIGVVMCLQGAPA